MSPMAVITAIVGITEVGSSGSACATYATSSAGAPAGGAARSGPPVGSPAMAARCSLPPAIPSMSRPGATARRSFVSARIFGAGTLRRISSRRPTGERSIRDADLGGTNPLPLDVPAPSGKQTLVLALGKDGRAYLLDRSRLGGIGGSLASEIVATRPIRTAPAAYPAGEGVYVAFQGPGAHCPDSRRGDALTVLQIHAGSPPILVTGWCGSLLGEGSPIVTTTDGHSNRIVWIVGAEGDNRLHGYRGDTGETLFGGGGPQDVMTGLRHFQSMLAARDRLFVGADGRLYAFAF
jgi:hypothetical protein